LLSDKLITINNAGSNYGVGNTLVFTGGAGTNAAGQIASVVETTTYDLLFEDGQRMLADGSYYDIIKNQDWSVKGPIKRIELTNFGTGYSSANLPSITISTTTGSSANLIATNIQGKNANVSVDTSNNITGIGSIRAVEITNFGINYSAANASASAVGDGNAILTPVISGLGIKEGVFLDDDGKIDYKIIQDSYYYQDYSYVIKSGLTFQTYSNTLKSIIHPAGLVYFGEISILNNLNVPAELVNNEDISRMLVQIFAQIYVGGNYEYSNINWTIKVEAPVLRLDTDLLDVQEYVIHLVPEGDEETGITDVGVIINQGAARHSFVIQTPFEVNVTSTSATLPTTKFVISHQDTLPGYGYNRYGDLPMTPRGVYGEDWSVVPISYLQDTRFSDFYGENPAYQSIMSLYIDNTFDVSVSGITSKLKYETFAVSGTIPLLESIVTTESLIVKPEIPIQLNVNDVAISMSTTAMERELPVFVTLADLDTYGEYVVVISPTPSLLDVSVAASSILPQKQQNAENLISLYKIQLQDVTILDSAAATFDSLLPQSSYEGTIGSFANSTFETSYLNYPLSYQEYNKIITPATIDSSSLSTSENIVVSYTASGFKYRTYGEILLSDLESVTIDAVSSLTFDSYYDTVGDRTIKASPSPFADGQATRPAPQDIFRSKYSRQINSNANSIVDFDTGSVTIYNTIAGTISSGNTTYKSLTLNEYSSALLSYVQNKTFESTVNTVLGVGTNLISNFSSGNTLLANSELFTVEAIANATFMTTTTAPSTAYSGVIAYKILT
jgi:hypothetical protein